ncbi:cell division protein FtsB [Serratia plymuthica]|uniref:Cell division protein FtsB n=1 Tax=Serratia inhibens TaxID=2338073 RepID=A0AA92X0C9_9GAMM|nr:MULTISPECIES: cell division protein FtsB [Serratia]MEE4408466.1 cell division protein FtsB [Serratia sp. C2(2)]MEE4448562.1 cell division protein FtsB [Serratia sp. C2(1)]ANS41215.1 Cell division protein FtsB [Serratia inhibens PRI-2C]QUY49139.1 cell division protein FtsB [Serratia plymuthica]RJF53005.1 cell division protein FtsB [Serratia inhibens]
MGKLTLLLLALLGWLQYSLWLGKNGVHDYVRVNEDVALQQGSNAKLKARNDQLFAEIDDLNGGQEAIEERARNELSMIKPGETFYRLVPDQSRRNATSSSQNNVQK